MLTLESVNAALKARRVAMVEGPRTIRQLAERCGVNHGTMHAGLSGRRHLPESTESAIRREMPELGKE